MNKHFFEKFEVVVFYILSSVVILYIAIEVIELVFQIGKALVTLDDTKTRLLISKEQTALILPVFFNILIAIELIDTFSLYIKEHHIKVQSILLIGLIAIGRKLLILDIGHSDGFSNLGLAAMILALSVGYYFVKKE